MGQWLASHGLLPEYIACSPAVRANETAMLLCEGADLSMSRIYHDKRIYMAGIDDLLAVIGDFPDCRGPLMLIGHNPGLEDLLLYLAGDAATATGHRKVLPTAALACLELEDDGRLPTPWTARLLHLVRPRELAKA